MDQKNGFNIRLWCIIGLIKWQYFRFHSFQAHVFIKPAIVPDENEPEFKAEINQNQTNADNNAACDRFKNSSR